MQTLKGTKCLTAHCSTFVNGLSTPEKNCRVLPVDFLTAAVSVETFKNDSVLQRLEIPLTLDVRAESPNAALVKFYMRLRNITGRSEKCMRVSQFPALPFPFGPDKLRMKSMTVACNIM